MFPSENYDNKENVQLYHLFKMVLWVGPLWFFFLILIFFLFNFIIEGKLWEIILYTLLRGGGLYRTSKICVKKKNGKCLKGQPSAIWKTLQCRLSQ